MKEEDLVIDDLLTEEGVVLVKAQKGLRFANYIVDSIICNFAGSAASFFLDESSSLVDDNSILMASVLLPIVISIVYYIFFEHYNNGQTIGKLLTGTKTLTKKGAKPSLQRIIGRTLSRYIPFDAFSYLGDSKSGWHDSISGTIVINIKQSTLAEDDMEF